MSVFKYSCIYSNVFSLAIYVKCYYYVYFIYGILCLSLAFTLFMYAQTSSRSPIQKCANTYPIL